MKLRTYIIVLGLIFGVAFSAQAKKQSLTYKYYEEKTGKQVEEHHLEIKDLKGDKKIFSRTMDRKKDKLEEEFVVDKNYNTLSVEYKNEVEKTNLNIQREGNRLFLKGTLNGKALNREIKLDSKPFYFSPKFNLTKFVNTGIKEIRFWTLRKDEFTKYLMVAKNRGVEKIVIEGKEIEVIKVKYSATGPGARFYKRTYYYRKSDGMFVKKVAPKKASSFPAILVDEF
ncbi:MAG: hypothetical protein ACI9F2_000222 [Lysobacterales bacterium]|jgi:hypothetical protein